MSIAQWTKGTFSVDAKDAGKGERVSHDTQRGTKIAPIALESATKRQGTRQGWGEDLSMSSLKRDSIDTVEHWYKTSVSEPRSIRSFKFKKVTLPFRP